MLAIVGPVFQRLYAGPRAQEVYGVPATEGQGLCENEIPLVLGNELETLGANWAIFTGRSPGEAALGMRLLGARLPSERLICASNPRYRKPRPDALLELAARTKATRLVFVGDNPMTCRQRAMQEMRDSMSALRIAPKEARAARFRGRGDQGLMSRPRVHRSLPMIRQTNETRVEVEWNPAGTGLSDVDTGIPFRSHDSRVGIPRRLRSVPEREG
jgi:hypothetical protein